MKYSYHGVINGNIRMNTCWITPKRYNAYSIAKCVLIYYLWHDLLKYQ
ncbi:hypothetical protein HMPREF9145_1980 [Segatella salivae F0493]|uniref:Uncharacterized protein n=1 Tax=Segatella salivae F0493 TaxID=1395125 RepID=U2L937_9BACT|nr:hypothetical protein HMPREF9145_1980 [Segatella salivae F0493]